MKPRPKPKKHVREPWGVPGEMSKAEESQYEASEVGTCQNYNGYLRFVHKIRMYGHKSIEGIRVKPKPYKPKSQ